MAEEPKLVGITAKKNEDFSEWYTQTIVKSEMADYSAVSGCMVIRPLGMSIWDSIRRFCEPKLKEMGVKNAYFPLLIPESVLKKESTHVQGFTPEVAWVTQGGNSELGERLAVRPTSEAIMYESYSKWIQSWRDLPLKLMQWNNVVRWEFKHPTLMVRTREFLWVEGHTVFAEKKEAEKEIDDVMGIWKDCCENQLALYGIRGKKTEKEKFAGAELTESLEFIVPSGKVAQGPDAHYDGQTFARAYDIQFLGKDGKKKFPHQNTWAITTRMIGVLVAVHGDDKGLVLPPNLAPQKAVIVPIIFEKSKKKVLDACKKLSENLKEFDILLDDRDGYSAGWKFNEWELKGMPVRIEIGPKDVEKEQAVMVRRDTGEKKQVALKSVKKELKTMLEKMQKEMLDRSKKMTEESIVEVKTLEELMEAIKNKKAAYAQFCNVPECEDEIKEKTGGAKTMNCKPGKGKCIFCGKDAKVIAMFGRSY